MTNIGTSPADNTAVPSTRHLNQEQLARRWSLSPRTLERWRSIGQGPSYLRLGGRVVYAVGDIETFEIAGRRIPAGRRP